MARCPECNKFVSFGDMEVDLEGEDYAQGELRYQIECSAYMW